MYGAVNTGGKSMKSSKTLTVLVITLAFAVSSLAETDRFSDGYGNVIHSAYLETSIPGSPLIGPSVACKGDFEGGWGGWTHHDLSGAGDYAHILAGLSAPSHTVNYTNQACFVADGFAGLPTSPGTVWTYGPANCTVHNQGGLLGPTAHLHNVLRSPPIPWPIDTPEHTGAKLNFEVFRHEELVADSPGMFYTWAVRSTASASSGDLVNQEFRSRNLAYYGAPSTIAGGDANVGDLLVPGRKWVQVELAVHELGYLWGWEGTCGTPAPYFDNVTLETFCPTGPAICAREMDLAQDAFPASGQIDVGVDMELNDVRFDRASNTSPHVPGDSIIVSMAPVGTGATLVETDVSSEVFAPRLFFVLEGNAVFDASVRIFQSESDWAALGGVVTANTGTHYEGYVYGSKSAANPDRWMFDLPDQNFLYPGDVLHYYIEAWELNSGGYAPATLPANLSGFGDFSKPLAYNRSFEVHALPTLFDDAGNQPKILFWNDFANRGGEAAWHGGFEALEHYIGEDYDTYYTNAPSSALGNGLGGRATFGQIDGYDTIVYSCGDLSIATITNDDALDSGDDARLLTNWLDLGDKYLFATGDNLASDLDLSGSIAQTLLNDYFGLTSTARDLRSSRGESSAPLVTLTSTDLWTEPLNWAVLGNTGPYNQFDDVAVTTALTQATTPLGAPAATWNTIDNSANNRPDSKVVYMPYDWSFIVNPPRLIPKADQPASLSLRVQLLDGILTDAGHPGNIAQGSSIPDPAAAFAAQAYPNPFNPATKIEYVMPQAGDLSVKVYNVRGELVRTLIDEVTAAGPGHVLWNGTSDQGRHVPSGVYFCEVRTGGAAKIQKLALLK